MALITHPPRQGTCTMTSNKHRVEFSSFFFAHPSQPNRSQHGPPPAPQLASAPCSCRPRASNGGPQFCCGPKLWYRSSAADSRSSLAFAGRVRACKARGRSLSGYEAQALPASLVRELRLELPLLAHLRCLPPGCRQAAASRLGSALSPDSCCGRPLRSYPPGIILEYEQHGEVRLPRAHLAAAVAPGGL